MSEQTRPVTMRALLHAGLMMLDDPMGVAAPHTAILRCLVDDAGDFTSADAHEVIAAAIATRQRYDDAAHRAMVREAFAGLGVDADRLDGEMAEQAAEGEGT